MHIRSRFAWSIALVLAGCSSEVPQDRDEEVSHASQSVEARGTFRIRAPAEPAGTPYYGWTTVRNTPSGFVIGNAANEWTMHRSSRSEAAGYVWDGGYIDGHFDGYGWVRNDADYQVNTDNNNYGSASTSIVDLSSYVSCPYNSECGDGTSVYLNSACASYANKDGKDYVSTLPAGTRVKWRYVTRDQKWTMVRVPTEQCSHSGAGGENHALGWRFLDTNCLAHLPPQRPGSPSDVRYPVVDRNNTPVYYGDANKLWLGQSLGRGEQMFSNNGRIRLAHQTDGNVVLYRTSDNAPLWSSNTSGAGTTHLVQQTAGNLVLYNGSAAVWASSGNVSISAALVLQDDCNMVIYNTSNQPIWVSNTYGRC